MPDPLEQRRQRIVALAQEMHSEDGQWEIDEDAVVSEGEGNGAYVQAWVWVPFEGTEFDKEKEENNEPEEV